MNFHSISEKGGDLLLLLCYCLEISLNKSYFWKWNTNKKCLCSKPGFPKPLLLRQALVCSKKHLKTYITISVKVQNTESCTAMPLNKAEPNLWGDVFAAETQAWHSPLQQQKRHPMPLAPHRRNTALWRSLVSVPQDTPYQEGEERKWAAVRGLPNCALLGLLTYFAALLFPAVQPRYGCCP